MKENIEEIIEQVIFDKGENLPAAYTLEEFLALGGFEKQ